MADKETFKFLADKSKEHLEKQIASFRMNKTYAGTVMGITALFIPFFLNGIDDAYSYIKLLALIPILLLLIALIFMLSVFRSQPVFQMFSVEKFQELINKTEDEVLLFEIGANNGSFRDNREIVDKEKNKVNNGILLATIGICIALCLLLYNKFDKPDKEPLKVKITQTMSDQPTKPVEKPVVIPTVPPGDRERIKEGVDPKPQTPNSPKGK